MLSLLKKREFVHLATATKDGDPNAAPKFLLKVEKPHIYLLDYSYGRTYKHLKENPRASLSFMDMDDLKGYRIYGKVELIEKGKDYKALAKEVEKKVIRLSAERVIEGSRTGKRYEHYELEIPDKFVVIKFKIEETTTIGTNGNFFREKELAD